MKHYISRRSLDAGFLTATLFAASLLATTPFTATLACYAQSGNPVGEQTTFSKSIPVEHPVAIPPDVLKLLLSTKEGREGMARATEVQKQNPGQMFRTSEIHLGAANEADLVIEGLAPMASGDHDWFWVVRPAGKKPRIALFAGGTSVEILDSRTSSFRDINSAWVYPNETLVSIYKFNGNKYTFRKVVNRKNR